MPVTEEPVWPMQNNTCSLMLSCQNPNTASWKPMPKSMGFLSMTRFCVSRLQPWTCESLAAALAWKDSTVHPSELSRNAKPLFAFQIPARSVMAGAKHHKPTDRPESQRITVTGSKQGQAEADCRRANRLTSI